MNVRRFRVHRAAWVALCAIIRAPSLEAQNAAFVPAAVCRGPVPLPFAGLSAPTVLVRITAEGELPDADVAAARALLLLTRDALSDRGAATLQTQIDVDRAVAASGSAVADVRGLVDGSKLLVVSVQRRRDSVAVLWTLRTVGDNAAPARSDRMILPIQDLARGGLAMAQLAARAGSPTAASLGTAPAPLPNAEVGNVFVVALAEALSPTPVALSRARTLLVQATTLAPTNAQAWRWRARVEQMLIDWNTSGDASTVRGLRASVLASATRAVQLAPRSNGAQVSLAEAYLGSNEREKAVITLLEVAGRSAEHSGMQRVAALYRRLRGNDARAFDQLLTAVEQDPRSAQLLVELASLARLRGDVSLACHALNAAVAADAELASSYALRALVRASFGERREAWADAEVATRLGHPEWGERAAAVLDARFAERNNALARLRPLGGLSAKPTNYLDALLLAEAALAISVRGASVRVATGLACNSLLRPPLLRDLRSIGVQPAEACAPPKRAAPGE